jgi:fluoride ion exporter CrcB/FEX
MHVSLVSVCDAGFGRDLMRLVGVWVGQLVAPEFRRRNLASNVIGSCALRLIAGCFAFCGPAPQHLRLTSGILSGLATGSAFSLDRCSMSAVRAGAPRAAWRLRRSCRLGACSATLRVVRL